MAKGLVNESSLNGIAEAINVLNGSEGTYLPSEMGAAIIDAIPTEEVTDDIVSVTDAAAYPAESLKFGIEPVQDLHGYDKPWPAGGGSNIWDEEWEVGGINVTTGANANFDERIRSKNYIPVLPNTTYYISAQSLYISVVFYDESKTYIDGAQSSGPTRTSPSNARYMRFSCGSDYGVTYNHDISINYPATVTTYSPYSNICPISGWTGVNGERTGVNVFDKDAQGRYVNGFINSEGGITNVMGWMISDYIAINYPNKYLAVGLSSGGQGTYLALYDNTKTVTRLIPITANQNNIIEPTNQEKYIRLSVRMVADEYLTAKFVEYAQIPITFPSLEKNLFGGTFDSLYPLHFGEDTVITVSAKADSAFRFGFYDINENLIDYNGINTNLGDRKYKSFTLPKETYYIKFYYVTVEDMQIELGSTATTYEPYTNTVYGGNVDVVNGKLLAYPEYDSYNGETLTGKWISDRDVYVEGTTPTIGAQVVDLSGVGTEYDITPQQVQMLLGDNNVWCNTGDTTLEYKVDLSRYIAKLQAQATPQLSLSRQAVSLEEPRDVEVRTDKPIEEGEEAEEMAVEDVESVDAAEDEPAKLPVEEDIEAEPISESEEGGGSD